MADVTANLVKELRERTGAGMMECKKALLEEKGDIELAIDNMRKSGLAKSTKKSGCIATEGIILTKIAQDSKSAIIIEINCETDFAAKDHSFKNFSEEVITEALNQRIFNVEDLRINFEKKRNALMARMKENINIRRLGILEGDMLGSYLHGMRIGVIISASNANKELLKHVAMHITASKPEYVDPRDIPTTVIAREHQIQLNIAMQSGKPNKVAEKIVKGRMRKFTSEISLTSQNFVMNPEKTVGQLLSKYDTKINKFIRFELGEGVKKPEVNFLSEVVAIGNSFK